MITDTPARPSPLRAYRDLINGAPPTKPAFSEGGASPNGGVQNGGAFGSYLPNSVASVRSIVHDAIVKALRRVISFLNSQHNLNVAHFALALVCLKAVASARPLMSQRVRALMARIALALSAKIAHLRTLVRSALPRIKVS